MKTIKLILISLLFPAVSLAAIGSKVQKELSFRCVSSMPTTSFILTDKGSEVVLTTIHHNGTKFMPIHEGIIVPNDLPYLTSKAEVLQKMSDFNEFKFPKEKCQVYGPDLINCSGGERKKFGDLEIEALSVSTSKVTEEFMGRAFASYRVSLFINITDFVPSQLISMNYYDKECVFSF